MSEPIKPCPFCGGEGLLQIRTEQFYIICRCCAGQGGWARTEGNAIRWWNTRVSQSIGEPEFIRCPQCKRENTVQTWQKYSGKCPNCLA